LQITDAVHYFEHERIRKYQASVMVKKVGSTVTQAKEKGQIREHDCQSKDAMRNALANGKSVEDSVKTR